MIGISKEGKISFIKNEHFETLQKSFSPEVEIIHVKEPKFIIPGFIDSHIHAPQYSFTGTGYDLPLLEWLNKYTFPAESKLSNEEKANQVYSDVIKKTLGNGTTTASYFATINLETTKLLVKLLYKIGQRALVGKVNMDQNSPNDYIETLDQSIKETEDFLSFTKQKYNEMKKIQENAAEILPILTPRFVPSCTPQLLEKLGEIAKKNVDVHIQSHISENKAEVEWVKELHPNLRGYADVYNHFGLLTNKTIMAHGIFLTDEELKLFKETGAGISHCPISNFALRSGVFNTRKALEFGVKVGLGTDVSGGYSPSMIEVMKQAVIASTTIYFQNESILPLTFKEVFYLATKGNAELLAMSDQIGSLEKDKFFDAVVIDPTTPDSPINTYDFVACSLEDIFQKFIFLGDSRNIVQVYVQGSCVLQK